MIVSSPPRPPRPFAPSLPSSNTSPSCPPSVLLGGGGWQRSLTACPGRAAAPRNYSARATRQPRPGSPLEILRAAPAGSRTISANKASLMNQSPAGNRTIAANKASLMNQSPAGNRMIAARTGAKPGHGGVRGRPGAGTRTANRAPFRALRPRESKVKRRNQWRAGTRTARVRAASLAATASASSASKGPTSSSAHLHVRRSLSASL